MAHHQYGMQSGPHVSNRRSVQDQTGPPRSPGKGSLGDYPERPTGAEGTSLVSSFCSFSNRHPCRLELTVSPCAPTRPLLLIVTQSPLFCAQLTTTKRAPAALAPRLRVSVAEVLPLTSNIEPLISNRNIPLLDTSLSSLKQRTSFFLIATRTPIRRNVASQVPGEGSLGISRLPVCRPRVEPGGSDAAQPGLFFVS